MFVSSANDRGIGLEATEEIAAHGDASEEVPR
jgi:hypothetical protein